MSKKAVAECAAQQPAGDTNKVQNVLPYRPLEAVFVDTPLGRVAKTKEFRCIRCFAIATFEVSDALLAVLGTEELAGDVLVNSHAHTAGWLYARVVRNGDERGYYLCPDCVEKDYLAYQQYAQKKS